jgi:molecular chaperone HscA
VDQAGLSLDQLQTVFLVGGSTHSVFVKEKIAAFLGRQPSTLLNPETAVACGAAIYAYNLIHQSSFLLLDVTPLSLGIETFGGIVEKLILRNTPLPAEKNMVFTTQIDGQTSIKIHVVQGEREMVSGCQSLGTFHLTGIPPLPKGQAKIKITLSLDIDGLLTVEAEECSGAIKQSLCINATRDVTYAQIEKEVAHCGEDVLERILVQKTQQAQDALNEVRRVLLAQPDAVVSHACQPLEDAIASKDLVLLVSAWETFSLIALPFLEAYMTHLLKNKDMRAQQPAPSIMAWDTPEILEDTSDTKADPSFP